MLWKVVNESSVRDKALCSACNRKVDLHTWYLPPRYTYHLQVRSQDLEKGGGYFERVRKVQTTLTRIFIVLESVSNGLSENSDEISRKARKFEGIFRPKSGGLQKK